MPTIDSKEFIDQVIKNNGWSDESNNDWDAPDNEPIVRIVEYTNMEGKQTWGCAFMNEWNLYRYEHETQYIKNPKLIWVRKNKMNAQQIEAERRQHSAQDNGFPLND